MRYSEDLVSCLSVVLPHFQMTSPETLVPFFIKVNMAPPSVGERYITKMVMVCRAIEVRLDIIIFFIQRLQNCKANKRKFMWRVL